MQLARTVSVKNVGIYSPHKTNNRSDFNTLLCFAFTPQNPFKAPFTTSIALVGRQTPASPLLENLSACLECGVLHKAKYKTWCNLPCVIQKCG